MCFLLLLLVPSPSGPELCTDSDEQACIKALWEDNLLPQLQINGEGVHVERNSMKNEKMKKKKGGGGGVTGTEKC